MKANSSVTTRASPGAATGQICIYADFQRRTQYDLFVQHSKWASLMAICDLFGRRPAERIALFKSIKVNLTAA